MNKGVYKYTIGRPDVNLKEHGLPVTNFGGFNTWASWQGTEDKAAVAGDFLAVAAGFLDLPGMGSPSIQRAGRALCKPAGPPATALPCVEGIRTSRAHDETQPCVIMSG